MGRPDDNISFSKPYGTHVSAPQHGSFFRRDTAIRSRQYSPPGPPPCYYAQSQSRDDFTHSGAVGGSSPYSSPGVDSPAHFPGGIPNRNVRIEDSMQLLQPTAFQTPAMVPHLYRTNGIAQSYGGNASHASRLQHTILPSGVGASARSFANDHHRLDFDPPAQVPGGIPHGNSVLANPMPSRPGTVSQPFSGTPSYGSDVIARRYEGDVRHSFYDPAYHRSAHSSYRLAPPHRPSPSLSSIPASRTETPHPGVHQLTPFADHTYQAVSFRGHGAQRSGSPRVFHVDGCLIDGDDLTDQGTNDGNIIVGECLRSDSPCGLWVKANKGSIKRHVQKCHGVARGGDTNQVSCTWAGCNAEMQKSAVPRHTLSKHFRETFQCNGCSRSFTRDYLWKSHSEKCPSSGYGYSVTHSPSTRTINVKGMSLR
ncbi:hypothetical protein EDB19DRAFT_1740114 [Suillus lakei]|nr:hypothetical protein EDB19DRAFT_1740114 [Suillus lakei]